MILKHGEIPHACYGGTVNGKLSINALNSGFKDFEDALQNFSATKYGDIDVILTRNIKDFKKSEIGVLTPETYLKTKTASR